MRMGEAGDISIKLLYTANYQQVRVKFILIVLSKIHSKKAVLWGFKALGDNLIYTQYHRTPSNEAIHWMVLFLYIAVSKQ